MSQRHREAEMSAAWPRYIILSGYGIATRHLIKEYGGEEWKERNMDRRDTDRENQTQTEKTKTRGLSEGNRKEINRHNKMFERKRRTEKEKDGGHLMMQDDATGGCGGVLLQGSSRSETKSSLFFLKFQFKKLALSSEDG